MDLKKTLKNFPLASLADLIFFTNAWYCVIVFVLCSLANTIQKQLHNIPAREARGKKILRVVFMSSFSASGKSKFPRVKRAGKIFTGSCSTSEASGKIF